MKFICLILVTLVFLGRPVSAQGISTLGTIDCGDWVKARDSSETLATMYQYYLIGFINGLALGKQVEFWSAKGIEVSAEQAFLWMDKYCREEPLSMPITGVFRLFEERTK